MSSPTQVLLDFATILSIAATVPLHESDTYQIPTPTLVDVNGNIVTPTGAFTYTSRNSNIATVDDSGLVTAIAIGSATILVSYGGLQSQLTIAVLDADAPTMQIAQPFVSSYPAKFIVTTPPVPSLGVRAPFQFN